MILDSDPHLFPPISPSYASQDRLPPLRKLKQLYATTQRRKVHLIFVFRHSRGSSATKDHGQQHLRDASAMACHVNNSGIADVATISVICARNLKGCFLPSFSNDMETELNFAAQSVVAARRSSKSLGSLLSEASRAAEFTMRIKSHIISAVMEELRPVLVSMELTQSPTIGVVSRSSTSS